MKLSNGICSFCNKLHEVEPVLGELAHICDYCTLQCGAFLMAKREGRTLKPNAERIPLAVKKYCQRKTRRTRGRATSWDVLVLMDKLLAQIVGGSS